MYSITKITNAIGMTTRELFSAPKGPGTTTTIMKSIVNISTRVMKIHNSVVN
ncbi:MAG: hypothetical protein MJZ03_03250 [archaeon]|nr:hypothetical protein [archaeon]